MNARTVSELLLTLYTDFSALLVDDVPTALAVAGVWLDPVKSLEQFDLEEEFDPEYGVSILLTLRQYFPEQYAEYWRLIHNNNGQNDWKIESAIVSELNALIECGELWDLEQVHWGPPIHWLGVGIEDEYFWEGSRAQDVAFLFRFDVDGHDPYLWNTGRLLSNGLKSLHPYQTSLINWLFSQSGNTIADVSYDEAMEGMPQSNDWSQLDHIREIYFEARGIVDEALEAIDQLEVDVETFAVFCSNVVISYCASIQENHHDRRDIKPRLYGNQSAASGNTGEADAGSAVLSVRDRAAA